MISISISREKIDKIMVWFNKLHWGRILFVAALCLSVWAIVLFLRDDLIVTYGDAESHLNISKRVFNTITPGFAHLGGIWLPLPHVFMMPFVQFDILWRTGLAGSIVGGISYIISCLYIYKLAFVLTQKKLASVFAFIVFATNPNILYLQATPLTEMLLIVFFILSSYYFCKFIIFAMRSKNVALSETDKNREFLYLIAASFFAFCTTLTRYDGWFLALFEALVVVLVYLPWRKYAETLHSEKVKGVWTILKHKFFLNNAKLFSKLKGMTVLFAVLAFFGIGLWFMWDFLILGDPLYFTHSQFSAKAQQENWRSRGQLPAYHDLPLSFLYYFVTAMSDSGVIVFGMSIVGFIFFLKSAKTIKNMLVALILLVPTIFNVLTLFMGQSVIFIPHLTPVGFDWRLFNVRYGSMMMPFVALFIGYLFYKAKPAVRLFLVFLLFVQFGLFFVGYSKVMVIADGTEGLSTAKRPDAERWLKKNYDGGLVLIDDFSRATSVIRSGIPMNQIIYIGNKPYYEDSFKEPEKYAKWIVLQKDDEIWRRIYLVPAMQGRLYKYFSKVYTSTDILIFKRNNEKTTATTSSP